jgi:hypothetical protein
MEVLEKRSPLWVIVQDGVSETDNLIALKGKHRELARPRFRQSASPYLLAFADDVPVEVRVEVGAPVMAPPTLGMEGRNEIRVTLRSVAVLCDQVPIRHGDLLIDPGIRTVHHRRLDRQRARSLRSLSMNDTRLFPPLQGVPKAAVTACVRRQGAIERIRKLGCDSTDFREWKAESMHAVELVFAIRCAAF